MSYLSFFSYAREDWDPYLKKFYKDLVEEIHKHTSLIEKEKICFRDSESIQTGELWEKDLNTSLSMAKVMICNYSPTYFTREYCGQEWAYFSARIDQYIKNNRDCEEKPAVIIPILWIIPNEDKEELPTCVSSIQFDNDDCGALYRKEGLRYIVTRRKCKGYKLQYRNILDHLRKRIIQNAKAFSLPVLADSIRIKEQENAFEIKRKPGSQKNIYNHNGPEYTKFVYLAGHANEFKDDIRKNLESYYDGKTLDEDRKEWAMFWKPYLPSEKYTIVKITQTVISNRFNNLVHEVFKWDENLTQMIKNAMKKNNIVIIIVDPWSLCLSQYKDIMQEYERGCYNHFHCTILVSFNSEDDETKNQYTKLQTVLSHVFRNRYLSRTPDIFNDQIESRTELENAISDAIKRIKQNLTMLSPVKREANGYGPKIRPQININATRE